MKQIQPDLWQTSPRVIDDMVATHAYLLIRPTGNLLLYGIGEGQDADLDAIEELGGVAVQVLSHRDETSPALNQVRDRFGSRLACSDLEVSSISVDAEPDLIVGPDCDDPALAGLEIFDTPGHTDGSISFRYESPHGKRYLFTGDTIVPSLGKWATFVVDQYGGTFEAMEQSLIKLRDMEPDVVLPSAFVGEVSDVEMGDGEWASIVNHRLERLRAIAPA